MPGLSTIVNRCLQLRQNNRWWQEAVPWLTVLAGKLLPELPPFLLFLSFRCPVCHYLEVELRDGWSIGSQAHEKPGRFRDRNTSALNPHIGKLLREFGSGERFS
jgi:hypothetical protein